MSEEVIRRVVTKYSCALCNRMHLNIQNAENCYDKCDTGSSVVRRIKNGEILYVVKEDSGWAYRIQASSENSPNVGYIKLTCATNFQSILVGSAEMARRLQSGYYRLRTKEFWESQILKNFNERMGSAKNTIAVLEAKRIKIGF